MLPRHLERAFRGASIRSAARHWPSSHITHNALRVQKRFESTAHESTALAVQAVFERFRAGGVTFFTGVPDSLLKDFCAYVTDTLPPDQHIIAANEGAAVGMAAGHHLGSGEIPVVYLQNSGLGNTVNPLLSLCHELVYRIPMILLIGWRGEPGVKDEPQHVAQGKLQQHILESMGLANRPLRGIEDIDAALLHCRTKGSPFALLVSKGAFSTYKIKKGVASPKECTMTREDAVKTIASALGEETIVVSTTGMTSRELFEHREAAQQDHSHDFLTVGSMGHATSIAAGVAIAQPGRQIVCLDGDGAFIMHMGAATTLGQLGAGGGLKNLHHIVINNGAHDSVGGQPTASFVADLPEIARASGYRLPSRASVSDPNQLKAAVEELMSLEGPAFLEVKVKTGARSDLGRPTTTPQQNKADLMRLLSRSS